jgi:hypothetical protein
MLRLVNIVLIVFLILAVNALFRFGRVMAEKYLIAIVGTVAILITINGIYFIVVKRHRIADKAIGAAAAGVRVKRKLGDIRQQIIDRADEA